MPMLGLAGARGFNDGGVAVGSGGWLRFRCWCWRGVRFVGGVEGRGREVVSKPPSVFASCKRRGLMATVMAEPCSSS